MRHAKNPQRRFVLVLVTLVVGMTLVYWFSQVKDSPPQAAETLTERHKQIISAQTDLSKWLIAIASGTLAALVGLRLKIPASPDPGAVEDVPMTAYAFLLASLFCGYLTLSAIVDILRVGPLDHLYGDQSKLPPLMQFWTLIVALVLLGFWLFRSKRTTLGAIVIACLCLRPVAGHAHTFDMDRCTKDWYQDRFAAAKAKPAATVLLMQLIARQPDALPAQSCSELESALDAVRFASSNAGNADSAGAFDKYVVSLNKELQDPALSTSDVVHTVVRILSFKPAYGVLEVRAQQGTCHIFLNGTEIGLTNWIRRLPPGTYAVAVVRVQDHASVFSSDKVVVNESATTTIEADKK